MTHPGVEGAPLIRTVGQAPKPLGPLRPEALREAEIDLAQDAGAVADAADRLLLVERRQRIERRQAGAQQTDRHGDDRTIGLDLLAAFQDRGDAAVVPRSAP